jgi:hypothetical protein
LGWLRVIAPALLFPSPVANKIASAQTGLSIVCGTHPQLALPKVEATPSLAQNTQVSIPIVISVETKSEAASAGGRRTPLAPPAVARYSSTYTFFFTGRVSLQIRYEVVQSLQINSSELYTRSCRHD